MRRLTWLLTCVVLLAPLVAHAQDDDDDARLNDDSSGSEVPMAHGARHRRRHKIVTAEEELSEEPTPDSERMDKLDDPRSGFSAELALSLALLDKSYGPGLTGLASFGVRGDYALGRLWSTPDDEFWREACLLELSYDYAQQSDGTDAVHTRTLYHYFNLRGLIGIPVRHTLLLYGAFGPGMTIMHATYDVSGALTGLTGIKPNLALGGGARLTYPVSDTFSFVARLELLGYRRGYSNDAFLTASFGGSF